jgi:import inner membrane translocase subunit TIM44
MRPSALAVSPLVRRLPLRQTSTALARYGRSTPYRRIATSVTVAREDTHSSFSYFPSPLPRLTSSLSLNSIHQSRHFSLSSSWRQETKAKESEGPASSAKAPKSEEEAIKNKETSAAGETAKDAKAEFSESSKSDKSESSESSEFAGKEEGKEDGKEEGKEKEDAGPPPPPPPHGDKTPWQVFVETLQQEFKASKDWNESTKALQSGYEEFTQNPALQKAKSAYEEASKTATTTTSAAFKHTGKAIGQSAAWAWETPVAKVVRKGATAAGSGIEKATRPVRETEAYKSVKNVIDDGSSSRYGGWIEKEERKRRRALREAQAMKEGKPLQPMDEDPKYASICLSFLKHTLTRYPVPVPT